MAKLENLSPGQVLYAITKQRCGSTTIYRKAIHSVKVISVHSELGYVVASWNENPARKYFARDVAKWRVKNPRDVTQQK